MEAGKMDRRITIQTYTTTREDNGEETKTWATLATVWAQPVPKKGREFFSGDQTVATADMLFRIRYRTDVTAKMRVSFDGQIYDIQHVAEMGRKQGLELVTTAKVSV